MALLIPPTDAAYCREEGRKLAAQYGQVEEIRSNIDLSQLSAVADCNQFFASMDALCSQMSSLATNLSFGKDPDAGYTAGNVFLGLLFGFGLGMAFLKWGLPKLFPDKAAPPATIQMNVQAGPPATYKQASAYKNLGATAAPPPPPPGPPPAPYAQA